MQELVLSHQHVSSSCEASWLASFPAETSCQPQMSSLTHADTQKNLSFHTAISAGNRGCAGSFCRADVHERPGATEIFLEQPFAVKDRQTSPTLRLLLKKQESSFRGPKPLTPPPPTAEGLCLCRFAEVADWMFRVYRWWEAPEKSDPGRLATEDIKSNPCEPVYKLLPPHDTPSYPLTLHLSPVSRSSVRTNFVQNLGFLGPQILRTVQSWKELGLQHAGPRPGPSTSPCTLFMVYLLLRLCQAGFHLSQASPEPIPQPKAHRHLSSPTPSRVPLLAQQAHLLGSRRLRQLHPRPTRSSPEVLPRLTGGPHRLSPGWLCLLHVFYSFSFSQAVSVS